MANQTWSFQNFAATEGTQAAVDFLNGELRQGPGEACAVARDDGSVGLFFLEPGSLGSSTAQTWHASLSPPAGARQPRQNRPR